MAVGDDPLGYYARLGVQPKAPTSVVKAAYRALAQEWHPDRNTSPEATARFQALQRAYETLADAAKRAAYDSAAASRAGPGREKRQTDAQPRPDGEASAPFRSAEPVRCKRCQAITASPRFRVFFTVAAYVLGATKTPTVGVYCARCEMLVGQGLNSPAFRAQGALVASLVVTLGLWVWMSHKQEIAAEQARLEAAGIARKQAAAIARAAAEELDPFLERLPPSGPFGLSTNFTHDPPVKVTAPVGANFFVKLADRDTGLPMYTLFVRSGDSAVVHVPPGAYKVKFASGQNWYGEDIRFGPDTAYSIVEDPVTFDVRGDQLPGREISLQLIRDGNLKRKTISAAQF